MKNRASDNPDARGAQRDDADRARATGRFGIGPAYAGTLADLPALRMNIAAWLTQPRRAGPAAMIPAAESGIGVPLIKLYGAPAERARQEGELVRGVMGPAVAAILRQSAPSRAVGILMDGLLAGMLRRIPRAMRKELTALAHGAGIPARRALALTIMGDLHAAGCSTIVATPSPAAAGQIIFGRNLDFNGFGLADVCGCVVEHHPEPGDAEIPYAQVGWTGLWGTYTGWNARGLCLGNMQAYNARPDVPRGLRAMYSRRWPTSWIYTELLRTCGTVAEALARFEGAYGGGVSTSRMGRPLAPANLMLADAGGDAALVESDARRMRVRRSGGGWLCATNHFMHPEMTDAAPECWRCDALEHWRGAFAAAPQPKPPLDAETMRGLLSMVKQQDLTLHSIVFEPKPGRIHLAAGAAPTDGAAWQSFEMDRWRP